MILLVNFGGPRILCEIGSFLTSLLTDQDVVRTPLPAFIHRKLFTWIARKRAAKIVVDYEGIGGGSPIYSDTENLAKLLAEKTGSKVITFHRYLPRTHAESLAAIEACPEEELLVLPLFPQFSYATTGSIARFFSLQLTPKTQNKLRWIKSYASSDPFIKSYEQRIRTFLAEKKLAQEDTILLFSSHGVPKSFITKGDVYYKECLESFDLIRKAFPNALSKLSFQSKFGPGEWIKPYTEETCEKVLQWNEGRKKIIVIPLSFTSDHIETLYEIQDLYIPILEKQGLEAYRCPALNLESYWVDNLAEIAKSTLFHANEELIRR